MYFLQGVEPGIFKIKVLHYIWDIADLDVRVGREEDNPKKMTYSYMYITYL